MKIVFVMMLVLSVGLGIGLEAASGFRPKRSVYSTVKKKDKKKNSSKNGNRRQTVAVLLKQKFKDIFALQKKCIQKGDSKTKARAKREIIKNLKEIAPHLKQLGTLPCLNVLTDVEKTVAEARKALPAAAEAGNITVIDILHQHYIDVIEAYKKD